MNRHELTTILRELAQIDMDCSLAYGRALERLESPLRDQLTRFRQEHEHHVAAIATALRREGEEPPERLRDLRGAFLEAFTAVRGLTGERGAMEAMRTVERLSRRRYEEARSHDLPPPIRSLLDTHHADETMHLNWIEQALRSRGWD